MAINELERQVADIQASIAAIEGLSRQADATFSAKQIQNATGHLLLAACFDTDNVELSIGQAAILGQVGDIVSIEGWALVDRGARRPFTELGKLLGDPTYHHAVLQVAATRGFSEHTVPEHLELYQQRVALPGMREWLFDTPPNPNPSLI